MNEKLLQLAEQVKNEIIGQQVMFSRNNKESNIVGEITAVSFNKNTDDMFQIRWCDVDGPREGWFFADDLVLQTS